MGLTLNLVEFLWLSSNENDFNALLNAQRYL